MTDINELEKEVGLLREKVELLRALEELKGREAVKEYVPCPHYSYGHPSLWRGTWTTGGSFSIDNDLQRMGNTPIFTGETTLYFTGGT